MKKGEKYFFGLISKKEFDVRREKMTSVILERQRQAAKISKKSPSEKEALNI